MSAITSTGLVWRVAGETDSEAEDSEYEDEEDFVPAGHASVTWCVLINTPTQDVRCSAHSLSCQAMP